MTTMFVDLENLEGTLRGIGASLEPRYLQDIVYRIAPVSTVRLYADFSLVNRTSAVKAAALGMDLVHVPAYPVGNGDSRLKSTADQRLELDCLEYVMVNTTTEVVVLAAMDRGYVHLLAKLAKRGVRRIVVGVPERTAWILRESADEFIPYEVGQFSAAGPPDGFTMASRASTATV
jgi:uncharacterized LabA/DUF88 family protein